MRDALAQVWRVLSGAEAREHRAAMADVDLRLTALEHLAADQAALLGELYVGPTHTRAARDA